MPCRVARICFFIAALGVLAPALQAQDTGDYAQRVALETQKAPNNQALWGVAVYDLSSNEPAISIDSDKLFMPASNRKLFSTAFALDTLGSEYRFSTKFEHTGAVDASGTLNGDLIVRASGDPTLSSRFRKGGNATGVFEDWADALLQKNIRVATGNLVVDLSCFDESTKFGEGWSWDYESSYYAAPTGAFSFNENVVFVGVAPTSSGNACRLWLDPKCDGFILENKTTTRSGGENTISVTRENGSNVIVARGGKPAGSGEEYNPIAVDDPCRYAGETLLSVLKRKGIEVRGVLLPAREAPAACDAANLVAEYISPPLSEILKTINQSSNNQLAEMIYLAAGRVATGLPASYDVSRAAEKKFWERLRIPDASRMYAADGSGLSRRNLFTPRAFCELLRQMRQHKEAEAFVKSLAVNGHNGTLEGRMSSIPNRIVGKTGTIANVSCLSGYLINSDDKTLVFSILVNHFTCPTASIKATQDKLCQLLVDMSVPSAVAADHQLPDATETGG